ncbi:uncharacterized protein LOC120358019 [Solenopsis invicta]|uniref:uncharacterized protein LOC120358019 n=1 Tax=Solenopsis invicta TaxID=13686 RepID=UPI00193E3913|nr:uncharacterized protein LOC120358019 [Solenopsis invicta]
MLYESKEPPLEVRISHISSKYIYKALANKSNPATSYLKSLRYLVKSPQDKINLIKKFPIFGIYIQASRDLTKIFRSTIPPKFQYPYSAYSFSPQINNSLTKLNKDASQDLVNQCFRHLADKLFKEHTHLYTDGSKSELSLAVGASVYIPSLNKAIMHKLPAETSIFSAEAWALLEAIGIIEELHWINSVIFTDSLSVLQAISQYNHKADNHIIYRLKHKLFLLDKFNFNLTLCWVPAHKGIPGNENADQAAKIASRQGFIPPFRIPYADYFAEINCNTTNKFRAYLEEAAQANGTQHASLYQHTLYKRPWFHRKPLDREEIVIINRLRSNHYNLKYSLFRKNMSDSPNCPCGEGRQDANHIIFYCPITIPKSSNLRQYLKDKYPSFQINIFSILGYPTTKLCRLILSYFKSCELNI